MRHYVLNVEDVCVTTMEFDLDSKNVVHNTKFTGGCQWNLKVLADNMNDENLDVLPDVIDLLCCKAYVTRQCAPKLKASLLLAIENLKKKL